MARKRAQRDAEAKKNGGKVPVLKPSDPVDIQYLNWLADAREQGVPFALPHDKALRFTRAGWVQEAVDDKPGSFLYTLTDGGLKALIEVLNVRNESDSQVRSSSEGEPSGS